MVTVTTEALAQTPRQVVNSICEQLRKDAWRVGSCIGNEEALARHCGASRTAVRAALNHLKEYDVVRVIPHKGIFVINNFTTAEDGIGVAAPARRITMIRWCDSLMEVRLGEGLSAYAAEHNCELNVLSVMRDIGALHDIIAHFPAGEQVLALVPPEREDTGALLQQLTERGGKVIQIDRMLPGVAAPALMYDHYHGSVLATRHLLETFHQPVWFFGYRSPIPADKLFCGWRDTMLDFGFFHYEDYIVPGDLENPAIENFPAEYFEAWFRRFFQQSGLRRMVIFAMLDPLAKIVYDVAAEAGLQIGRDIFVCGFGNNDFSGRLTPSLSTVAVGYRKLGAAVGELALNWPKTRNFCRLMPVTLIPRESSLLP